MVALIVLTLVVLACLFPSIPARYGETRRLPKTDTTYINSPPSSKAWFGTDDLNRDLYSRIFYGGRVSIMIGISVALIACTVGTIVGALAGYIGGWLDDILMRITDVFLAFPILVSLLVLRNVLAEVPLVKSIMGDKTSVRFMVILLSAVGWMAVARIVRGVVLSLKEREFIEASRSVGASGPRIMFRHLIPNALGPIMVVAVAVGRRRDPRRVDAVVLRLRAKPGRGPHDLGSADRRSRRRPCCRATGGWWSSRAHCW